MALQTSTYHLQNEKHSQLHLYKIPYWDMDGYGTLVMLQEQPYMLHKNKTCWTTIQESQALYIHNLYIMPTMAPQTSTYHLQNEKHSQLHLYKIPYWDMAH